MLSIAEISRWLVSLTVLTLKVTHRPLLVVASVQEFRVSDHECPGGEWECHHRGKSPRPSPLSRLPGTVLDSDHVQ